MNRIEATLSRRLAAAKKARQEAFRQSHISIEAFHMWLANARRSSALRSALLTLKGAPFYEPSAPAIPL